VAAILVVLGVATTTAAATAAATTTTTIPIHDPKTKPRETRKKHTRFLLVVYRNPSQKIYFEDILPSTVKWTRS
jgi:uncharacterized membrane protein YphA (DoxX/SURF4 family)